jgi:hypothetical protein
LISREERKFASIVGRNYVYADITNTIGDTTFQFPYHRRLQLAPTPSLPPKPPKHLLIPPHLQPTHTEPLSTHNDKSPFHHPTTVYFAICQYK